jgi:hypothetical protein
MGKLSDPSTKTKSFIKLLLIGNSKAGKTHYAAQAANVGYKVLYLDGDVGLQTLSQPGVLTDAAKENVYYFPVQDKGDVTDSTFYDTLLWFVQAKNGQNVWNDTNSVKQNAARECDPADVIWKLHPSKLDYNTVVIVDSWTAFCYSILRFVGAKGDFDLSDMEKADRGAYASTKNAANFVLSVLKGLRCHVIVIAHSDEMEKRRASLGKIGSKTEKDFTIESIMQIPASTSRPHGSQMGMYFSDIGWIEIDREGKRTLSFEISPTRVSGGHLKGKDTVEKFSFANLIAQIGGEKPVSYQPGEYPVVEELTAGSWSPEVKAARVLSQPKGSESTATILPKANSLANLIAKK